MTVKCTYHIVGEPQHREITFKNIKSFDVASLWSRLSKFSNAKSPDHPGFDDARFYCVGERGRPSRKNTDTTKCDVTAPKKMSLMHEAKLAHFGKYMSCKEIDALPETERKAWLAFYQNYRYNSEAKHDECIKYRKQYYDRHADELRAKARAKYAKSKANG